MPPGRHRQQRGDQPGEDEQVEQGDAPPSDRGPRDEDECGQRGTEREELQRIERLGGKRQLPGPCRVIFRGRLGRKVQRAEQEAFGRQGEGPADDKYWIEYAKRESQLTSTPK